MISVRIYGTVLALLILTGCAGTWDLTIEKVQAITPGRTTKADLMEHFGPLPSRLGPDDPAYTLFPQSSENDRLYFFDTERSHTLPVPLILYIHVSKEMRTDRLWALVNESTGVVEDYAFKQYGTPVIYGKPRGGTGKDRSTTDAESRK